MMSEQCCVKIDDPEAVSQWREKARALDRARVRPDQVTWIDGATGQNSLFGGPKNDGMPPPREPARPVSARLISLLLSVIRHSSPERYGLAYKLLWRSRDEPQIMRLAADPDLTKAEALSKSVRRDAHKMKAFVRFRGCEDPEGVERFVAWFEPEHHIVSLTAPFFARRFANMRFSILTPCASVHWDMEKLAYGPGMVRSAAPQDDEMEEVWRTYYASIFNPARLKIAAMTSEMPKKYWHNMPEGQIVASLIQSAQKRTEAMVAAPPVSRPASLKSAWVGEDTAGPGSLQRDKSDVGVEKPAKTLTGLYGAAAACTRCPLHQTATQLVPGAGPKTADVMLVGEQPGDMEDLEGRPFVGPAGQLLDRALSTAGIDRGSVYVTNAVKHFKHEMRGKRRLHKTPSVSEIEHCRWWLLNEIALVKPRLIVALGSSAARSVLGAPVRVMEMRGQLITRRDAPDVLVTVHPSFLLRLTDDAKKVSEQAQFVADLRLAAPFVAGNADGTSCKPERGARASGVVEA